MTPWAITQLPTKNFRRIIAQIQKIPYFCFQSIKLYKLKPQKIWQTLRLASARHRIKWTWLMYLSDRCFPPCLRNPYMDRSPGQGAVYRCNLYDYQHIHIDCHPISCLPYCSRLGCILMNGKHTWKEGCAKTIYGIPLFFL